MKWKKVIKLTHKYVAWQCFYSLINVTFSCPCAHHDGIWQRGGTTPHIINPCTLCHRTISWPLFEVLTYLFLHNISLAIKTGDSFTQYISWYPYLYGLLDFSITYPHSLELRGTLALYVCVWSASQSTCITLWENARVPTEQEAGWARDLAWSPVEVKNLLTLPGT